MWGSNWGEGFGGALLSAGRGAGDQGRRPAPSQKVAMATPGREAGLHSCHPCQSKKPTEGPAFSTLTVTPTCRQHPLFGTCRHPPTTTGWRAHPMLRLGLSLDSHPQPPETAPDPPDMCRPPLALFNETGASKRPPGVMLWGTALCHQHQPAWSTSCALASALPSGVTQASPLHFRVSLILFAISFALVCRD